MIDKLFQDVFTFLPDGLKNLLQEHYVQLLSTQKVLEFINLQLERLNGMRNIVLLINNYTLTIFYKKLFSSKLVLPSIFYSKPHLSS